VAWSPGLDRANALGSMLAWLAQWQTPLLGEAVLLLPLSAGQLAGFPPVRFESSSGRSSKND
jgi:hypothetical protein